MAKDKATQSQPAVNAAAAKPAKTAEVVGNVKPAAEVKAAPAEKLAPVKEKFEKVAETVAETVAEIKAEKSAPAKKPAAKKAPVKTDVFLIQGAGEHTVADITELCKANYKNGSRKHVKSIDVYVKAENGELRAYYVVNGNPEGKYIVL